MVLFAIHMRSRNVLNLLSKCYACVLLELPQRTYTTMWRALSYFLRRKVSFLSKITLVHDDKQSIAPLSRQQHLTVHPYGYLSDMQALFYRPKRCLFHDQSWKRAGKISVSRPR